MLIINNIKFAKNESELVDSLFAEKTAYGYYKTNKNKSVIYLMNKDKKVFAAVVSNPSGYLAIGNCQKLDKGYFYGYGLSSDYEKLLGIEKYSDNKNLAAKALKDINN